MVRMKTRHYEVREVIASTTQHVILLVNIRLTSVFAVRKPIFITSKVNNISSWWVCELSLFSSLLGMLLIVINININELVISKHLYD
jgi:hypothetical protein